MSVNRSRYVKYSIKKVPHKKRSLPIRMAGDDWTGKWFKCWNCGFINNIDRAQVADVYQGGDKAIVFESDDLVYGSNNIPSNVYPEVKDNLGKYITLDFPFSINLMKLDAQGNVVEPHVSDSVKIIGGCAQCGSMNWK